MLTVLVIAEKVHGISIAMGETESLAKEPLRMFDQFMHPSSLQAELG